MSDSQRLKELWRFGPDDIGLWRVAYPKYKDFIAALDRWISEQRKPKP